MRLRISGAVRVCLLVLCVAETAKGQARWPSSDFSRYELGVAFHFLQLNGALTGGGIGPGLHFGYNYNRFVSFETDISGQSVASDRANTLVSLFGPRIGYTGRNAGIYVNLRPGLIHFPSDGDVIAPVARHRTRFTFDTGVVVVRYFPNHMYLRFDVGRMFVDYGGGSYTDPMTGQITHLGVPGGVSASFGMGAHW
jgi:hypothetical protein